MENIIDISNYLNIDPTPIHFVYLPDPNIKPILDAFKRVKERDSITIFVFEHNRFRLNMARRKIAKGIHKYITRSISKRKAKELRSPYFCILLCGEVLDKQLF